MTTGSDPAPSGAEPDEEMKLEKLRQIAAEVFAELDRGDYVTVRPEGLDEFMDRFRH